MKKIKTVDGAIKFLFDVANISIEKINYKKQSVL